jgi:hypothetical protein
MLPPEIRLFFSVSLEDPVHAFADVALDVAE